MCGFSFPKKQTRLVDKPLSFMTVSFRRFKKNKTSANLQPV